MCSHNFIFMFARSPNECKMLGKVNKSGNDRKWNKTFFFLQVAWLDCPYIKEKKKAKIIKIN